MRRWWLLLVLMLVAGCAPAGGGGKEGLAALHRASVEPAGQGLVFGYQGRNGYAGFYWATAVYADGQVIAATEAGVRTGLLSPEQVRILVGAATAAVKPAGEARDCQATDLSDETFEVRTRTGTVEARTYGLGCGRTAHLKRLTAFREALAEITARATEPHTPVKVLVWAGQAGTEAPGPAVAPWPLPDHPPDAFPAERYRELPGEVAGRLSPEVGRAVYAHNGRLYWLQWQPVVPELPLP